MGGASESDQRAAQQQARAAGGGPANSDRDSALRSGLSTSRAVPARGAEIGRRKKTETDVMRREIDSW